MNGKSAFLCGFLVIAMGAILSQVGSTANAHRETVQMNENRILERDLEIILLRQRQEKSDTAITELLQLVCKQQRDLQAIESQNNELLYLQLVMLTQQQESMREQRESAQSRSLIAFLPPEITGLLTGAGGEKK